VQDIVINTDELLEFASHLNSLSPVARRLASNEIVTTARAIRQTARSLAPRNSGHLAGSIEATGPRGGTLRAGDSLEAEIGPTAFYGGIVEYGGADHGPQPYMDPAADAHANDLEQGIAHIADHVAS
jgi:HK97 gp10 family phage protein